MALRTWRIAQREMEAAGSYRWFGLRAGDRVLRLVAELQQDGAAVAAKGADVADLQQRRVKALPLLLQAGLLSVAPGRAPPLQCRPPNEYSRATLQMMLWSAMKKKHGRWGERRVLLALGGLHTALRLRSPGAFAEAVQALLLLLPSALSASARLGLKGKDRTAACLHASLACALLATAQAGVCVDLAPGAAGGGEQGEGRPFRCLQVVAKGDQGEIDVGRQAGRCPNPGCKPHQVLRHRETGQERLCPGISVRVEGMTKARQAAVARQAR
jgi:hypothetical protein